MVWQNGAHLRKQRQQAKTSMHAKSIKYAPTKMGHSTHEQILMAEGKLR